MRALFFLLLLSFTLLGGAAHANEAAPLAADPVAEKRLVALTEQLRCLVCQNQSIADSHAELAMDLKNEVRKMIAAGKTDQEITDFMVARYGDFVLYKPPFKASTFLLWLGPALLMLVGLLVLVINLRRRNRQIAAEAPLSLEDQAKADALLQKESQS